VIAGTSEEAVYEGQAPCLEKGPEKSVCSSSEVELGRRQVTLAADRNEHFIFDLLLVLLPAHCSGSLRQTETPSNRAAGQ
jgi:hypothetical protein